MHHRIFISSEDSDDSSDFSYPIGDYTTLNDFSGKAVYIGLEWISTIAASDFQADYAFDIQHPNALMLVLKNVPVHNQAVSWNTPNPGSILALLPGYVGTGFYGVCNDSPYLQSSALPLVSHGDDLRSRAALEFGFLASGTLDDGTVKTFKPVQMLEWAGSIVLWTVEPERPLTPYDHFHIWLNTADRISGTVDACTIPVDLTTFSMHSREDGAWHAAVSYISPIFHNVEVNSVLEGLVLTCDDFRTSRANQPVLTFLNRTHVPGEERYYGRRLSVKPVNSDTLGLPIREPIDNLASLRLRLLDVVDQGVPANAEELADFTVCISIYRIK